MNGLLNISPIDGRYQSKTKALRAFFSEFGLIRYRVVVEIEYLIALNALEIIPMTKLSGDETEQLQDIYRSFGEEEALRVKQIEQSTNHDVKAVEYFIKEQLDALSMGAIKEWVHFGLTSQDINNTAIPLSLKLGIEDVLLPLLNNLKDTITAMQKRVAEIPMLARTHGQPASPTKLDKELRVYTERLHKQIELLDQFTYEGKFGGATGNFNAHTVAFPAFDWAAFADDFLADKLGLKRQHTTTQISHYDDLAELFHTLSRINTILIDFSRDIWSYISMDYFKQKVVAGEVGSSTMPHKVNPIDFENAEGNLGMANAVFHFLAEKLPVSRLQRDLTDSTVLRNVGVPVGHTVIALQSLIKGIGKLTVNRKKIEADLHANWAVVGEAIQTILRRELYPNPYEALKGLTRGKNEITQEEVWAFIDSLNVSEEVKAELKSITPENYTGNA